MNLSADTYTVRIVLDYTSYFLLFDFLWLDPDSENLTGSGSQKKVRIRPDLDPQHWTGDRRCETGDRRCETEDVRWRRQSKT